MIKKHSKEKLEKIYFINQREKAEEEERFCQPRHDYCVLFCSGKIQFPIIIIMRKKADNEDNEILHP